MGANSDGTLGGQGGGETGAEGGEPVSPLRGLGRGTERRPRVIPNAHFRQLKTNGREHACTRAFPAAFFEIAKRQTACKRPWQATDSLGARKPPWPPG